MSELVCECVCVCVTVCVCMCVCVRVCVCARASMHTLRNCSLVPGPTSHLFNISADCSYMYNVMYAYDMLCTCSCEEQCTHKSNTVYACAEILHQQTNLIVWESMAENPIVLCKRKILATLFTLY